MVDASICILIFYNSASDFFKEASFRIYYNARVLHTLIRKSFILKTNPKNKKPSI